MAETIVLRRPRRHALIDVAVRLLVLYFLLGRKAERALQDGSVGLVATWAVAWALILGLVVLTQKVLPRVQLSAEGVRVRRIWWGPLLRWTDIDRGLASVGPGAWGVAGRSLVILRTGERRLQASSEQWGIAGVRHIVCYARSRGVSVADDPGGSGRQIDRRHPGMLPWSWVHPFLSGALWVLGFVAVVVGLFWWQLT